ncbi:MAG: hypothetical protein RSB72_03165, partial [Bacilli bacterium]
MRELFILSLIPFIMFLFMKTKKGLHMLQLNWYNDDQRFLKWIIKNPFKVFLNTDMFFVIFTLCLVVDINISYLMFAIFYLGIIYLFAKEEKNEQTKLKFNFTKRARRLAVTTLLIYLLPISIMVIFYSENLIAYYYLVLGVFAYFNYFFVILA